MYSLYLLVLGVLRVNVFSTLPAIECGSIELDYSSAGSAITV